MGFRLRDGLTVCETGGRLIFLDVVADRYFGLDEKLEEAFKRVLEDPDQVDVPQHLRDTPLLVETGEPSCLGRCSFAVARRSLLDVTAPVRPGASLLAALLRIWRVRRALERGRLKELLEDVRERKGKLAPKASASIDALRQLARDFEQTARLTRSHDQCLSRSIAFAQLAMRRDIPVDLVIGVRLNPFAAHSWIQRDGWLLNDHTDSATTYDPILVV